MEFFHVSEPTLNDHIKQVRTHTIHNVFIFWAGITIYYENDALYL